jgi:hypothetical protein
MVKDDDGNMATEDDNGKNQKPTQKVNKKAKEKPCNA